MGKFNGKIVKFNGITFFFKYEDKSDLLHIYVRHLTTIKDSLEIYFEGLNSWNNKYKRFETYTKTHGLFWFWINEKKKKVMIISCFKVNDYEKD